MRESVNQRDQEGSSWFKCLLALVVWRGEGISKRNLSRMIRLEGKFEGV